jgi:hypothetical protein
LLPCCCRLGCVGAASQSQGVGTRADQRRGDRRRPLTP